MEDKLKNAREEISKTDEKIAELFVYRMKQSEAVAEYKRERGLPVEDMGREEELIAHNSSLVKDDGIRPYYVGFLRDVMKISREYQHRLTEGAKIAYCGEEGAFAYFAAKKLFPDGIYIPRDSFSEAYDSVCDGDCDCAVLPIENSYAGEVGQVTDMIFSGSLVINRVCDLPVNQTLLCVPGAVAGEIKTVISHPQALAQCAGYIKKHGFSQFEAQSTSAAAKAVAEKGERSLAAIACEEAAELYGLCALDRDINESRGNTTRFGVFARCGAQTSGTRQSDGFCLVFTVKNEAGSLARAIDIIGKAGFNMRTLRSRPMKELAWRYYFYIEAEGAIRSPEGEKMMLELAGCCDRLKVAGIYN